MSKEASVEKTFVSRQPIYDSTVQVHAYELVSQPRQRNPLPTVDELETLRADLGTFTDVGLDQIVGAQQAFVGVRREAVLAGHCEFLSKHRVVLKVLDDIVSDPALRVGLEKLASKGYRIAVPNPTAEPLNGSHRSIADIVRVDIRDLREDEFEQHVDALSRLSVKVLAEHVSTYEQFELCKKHKFDMFQGYFFCEPRGRSTPIPVNRLAAIRLLGKLQNPDLSLNELEETISSDLALSYKLLRFANSAFIGMNRAVESINHAAKMVGIDRIRVWASLLMFAKMEDKPRELMIMAIVRAAMCERLAVAADAGPRETFFTVGLLSVLDALMDRPMEEASEQLPLASDIRLALTQWEGSSGEALRCTLAYERGEWDQVHYEDVPPMTIRSHYLDSLGWARRISEGLNI